MTSGDYKRRNDPTCAPFEPVDCDLFMTEATFGLPVFRLPPDRKKSPGCSNRRRCFPNGRIWLAPMRWARRSGSSACCAKPAMTERCTSMARWRTQRVLSEPGHRFGHAGAGNRRQRRQADFAGAIVVGPPSAFADRWARRFPDPISCFASGWMRIRQRAKQGGVELPLIISDHADWDELTATIKETGAGRNLGDAWPRGSAGALVRAGRHRRATAASGGL